jgi:hypothetical protein
MISPVGYGLCAVAYGSLALFVAWRTDSVRRRRSVAICCLITALWAITAPGQATGATPVWAPQVVEIIRNAAWLLLLLALLAGVDTGDVAGRRRLSARWLLPPVVLLMIALTVAASAPTFASSAWALTPLLQTFSLIIPVLGLLLLENLFRNSGPSGRWGYKHLCLGLGAVFAFDFIVAADSALLSRIDPDFLAARGLVTALTAAPVAISLTRMGSWRAREMWTSTPRGGRRSSPPR